MTDIHLPDMPADITFTRNPNRPTRSWSHHIGVLELREIDPSSIRRAILTMIVWRDGLHEIVASEGCPMFVRADQLSTLASLASDIVEAYAEQEMVARRSALPVAETVRTSAPHPHTDSTS